ncbi:MAG: Rieske (2Fe-2S) protein [Myxococcales bacterium]|nr:Rieske (2Fe-2S) protein [Myxococcales bacterium]MCB9705598.1 Rieske (2Fe-2S) protein [Myxococcales bacterium]
MARHEDRLGRRELLVLGSWGLGALAVGCGGKIEGLRDVSSEGGVLHLTLADFPALGEVGGNAVVRADGKGKPILVRQESEGVYVALSLKCTHLGCGVKLDEASSELACPCHGSRFSLAGEVLKGPAGAPLDRYPASREGDAILVNLA